MRRMSHFGVAFLGPFSSSLSLSLSLSLSRSPPPSPSPSSPWSASCTHPTTTYLHVVVCVCGCVSLSLSLFLSFRLGVPPRPPLPLPSRPPKPNGRSLVLARGDFAAFFLFFFRFVHRPSSLFRLSWPPLLFIFPRFPASTRSSSTLHSLARHRPPPTSLLSRCVCVSLMNRKRTVLVHKLLLSTDSLLGLLWSTGKRANSIASRLRFGCSVSVRRFHIVFWSLPGSAAASPSRGGGTHQRCCLPQQRERWPFLIASAIMTLMVTPWP